MAPPVEEMETRDVSLVLSDMIKYGRYKPITTGRKLGYQPTLSRFEYGARRGGSGPPLEHDLDALKPSAAEVHLRGANGLAWASLPGQRGVKVSGEELCWEPVNHIITH